MKNRKSQLTDITRRVGTRVGTQTRRDWDKHSEWGRMAISGRTRNLKCLLDSLFGQEVAFMSFIVEEVAENPLRIQVSVLNFTVCSLVKWLRSTSGYFRERIQRRPNLYGLGYRDNLPPEAIERSYVNTESLPYGLS